MQLQEYIKARQKTCNYHENVTSPIELMNEKDILVRKKANEELSKIFYKGSEKIGKF